MITISTHAPRMIPSEHLSRQRAGMNGIFDLSFPKIPSDLNWQDEVESLHRQWRCLFARVSVQGLAIHPDVNRRPIEPERLP